MTREQTNWTEDLIRREGGQASVREGFADGHVNVTLPQGPSYELDEDALRPRTVTNFSIGIDWSAP